MLKRVSRRGRIVLAVVLAAVLGAGTGAGVVLYAAGNGSLGKGQLGALAWYSNNYTTGTNPFGVVSDGVGNAFCWCFEAGELIGWEQPITAVIGEHHTVGTDKHDAVGWDRLISNLLRDQVAVIPCQLDWGH